MFPEGPASLSLPEVRIRNTTIEVLSVSPHQDDHNTLERLLHGQNWKVYTILSFASAVELLQTIRIPLVVCERDLLPGTWRDMLDHLTLLPQPPYLIVTCKFADEHLWAEALNIGAYDVLAKPFHAAEVDRILRLAWLHWHDKYDAEIQAPKTISASTSQMSDVSDGEYKANQ